MVAIPEIYIIIVAAIACIFSIASTSIGIQAFNENTEWRKAHSGNFTFLIINLVVSILVLILSLVALGLHIKLNM
jgi:hypothetical protein